MIPQLIIALTLVAEAGGIDDPEAMSRVLTVIGNRAEYSNKGTSTYETLAVECLRPNQFSCWNDPKLIERAKKHPKLGLALAMLKYPGSRNKQVGKARHYLSHKLYFSKKCPKWAKTGRITYDEGPKGHVFLEGVK